MALACVCVELPHLSGLAHQVELLADSRVATAAVTPSGRVLLNPDWFTELELTEATFIMAHELLHLALEHHARLDFSKPESARLANLAADAVINDMLMTELLRYNVPCGGVCWSGARELSSEALMLELRQRFNPERPAWKAREPEPAPEKEESPIEQRLREAGLLPEPEPPIVVPRSVEGFLQDLLPTELEREWFPEPSAERAQRIQRIEAAGKEALAVGTLLENLEELKRGRGVAPGGRSLYLEALETAYAAPWEMALQRWVGTCAPPTRSWARPSRRGTSCPDVVLPGRRRDGWTLNIVLDTSGSMRSWQSQLLGVIGAFCRNHEVADVRILQCDVEVTVDERVAPEELKHYRLAGFGGSDMSPAMFRLAEEPEVQAAIVVTDGFIAYPPAVPYSVLWAVTSSAGFAPPYGQVIPIVI